MKYIDDLRNELKQRHVKPEIIQDILSDYEELIQEAMNDGLTESELHSKFGNPVKVASELATSSNTSETIDIPSGEPWKTFVLSKSDISLDIKLINEDFVIHPTDQHELMIFSKGKNKHLADYTCKLENGVLTFHSPKHAGPSFFGFHSDSLAFELYIPQSVLLVQGKVTSVNGDGIIKGIDASQLELNSTNGDLNIEKGTFGRLKYNTVNGDISLKQLEVATLIGSAVSGDAVIQETTIKDFYLNTVSGDTKVSHSTADEAELSTVSGDFEGIEFYPKRLSIKSVSGDIDIQNQQQETIEVVRKSTVSGTISIGIPR